MRILVFDKEVCDVRVPVACEESTGRLETGRNVMMLNLADRLLFAGNAFEPLPAPPARMMMPVSKPEEDQAAPLAWTIRLSNLASRGDAP